MKKLTFLFALLVAIGASAVDYTPVTEEATADDATFTTATIGAVIVNSIDTAGAADIDIGSADVLDVTITTDGGVVTIDGSIQMSATALLDATGAVDMDYGSADVLDHTFTTDGTGTAEIVLPAGSIDGTEILDGTVSAADLSAAVQDQVAYITIVGADLATNGTGTVTIQAKDAAGNNLAATIFVRTWIGTADDFGADALTDYSVSTGTSKEEVAANAEYLAVSDTNGVIAMAVDKAGGAAGSVYAWAELGGRVVASGELVLSAP